MVGCSDFLLRRCENQLASLPIAAAVSEENSEEETIASRMGISRRTELSDLPEDQMVDILLRLPIKFLMRSKCVSKGWYNLITSPTLVSAFNAKNKGNEVTIYSQTPTPDSTDTSSRVVTIGFHDTPFELTVPQNVLFLRIVGCSDGLVCLSFGVKQQKFGIWNPATREFKLTPSVKVHYSPPPPCDRIFSSGFCYNPIANAHQIARLTFYEGGEESYLEANSRVLLHLFTLGSNSNSWVEKSLFLPLRIGYAGLRDGVTCVNKYLFWTSNFEPRELRSRPPQCKYIVCFDMVHQLFSPIELPCPDRYRVETRIIPYKDTLAIFTLRRGPPFDIWVLNDCGSPNHSWSLQRIGTPSSSLQRIYLPETLLSKGGGVYLWLIKSSSGSWIWDPQTGETIKNVGITQQLGGCATYSPSLASVCC